MAGQLIRVLHERGFVQIENETVRDAVLSFRARGVLAYLLSMTDGWSISAERLAEQSPDGRHAILGALRELQDRGYIIRKRERQPDGTLRTVTYVRESLDLGWPFEHQEPIHRSLETELRSDQGKHHESAGGTGSGSTDDGSSDSIRTPSLEHQEHQGAARVDDLSSRRAARGRKSDPRADDLVREWWEAQDPRPLQPWAACVQIVSSALGKGWTEEPLRAALRSCEPPLSGGKLDAALRRVRAEKQASERARRLDPGAAG